MLFHRVFRIALVSCSLMPASAYTTGAALASAPVVILSAEALGVNVAVSVEPSRAGRCYFSESSFVWGAEDSCPRHYIREMSINIEGRPTFVPLSVFSDLGNPTQVSVRRGKDRSQFVIDLHGGDAATSYLAFISVRNGEVASRRVVSKTFPKEAYEVTQYRWNRTSK